MIPRLCAASRALSPLALALALGLNPVPAVACAAALALIGVGQQEALEGRVGRRVTRDRGHASEAGSAVRERRPPVRPPRPRPLFPPRPIRVAGA